MNSVVLYKACSFEIPDQILKEISNQDISVVVTTHQRKKKWESLNRGFVVIIYQDYQKTIGKLSGKTLIFDEFYLIHRYILDGIPDASVLFDTTSRFEKVSFISSKGLVTNVNLLQNVMILSPKGQQKAIAFPEEPRTETLIETERKHPFHIGIGVVYFFQFFAYIDLFILSIIAFIEFIVMGQFLISGDWQNLGATSIIEAMTLLAIGIEYLWLRLLGYIRKLFLIRLNRAANRQNAERHAAELAAIRKTTSRNLLILFNKDEKYRTPRIRWAPATPLQIYLSMELMQNKKLDLKTRTIISKFREGEHIENLFESHSDFKNCEDGCVIGNIPSEIRKGVVQYPHKYYAILCDIFGMTSSFEKIMELSVAGKTEKITEMFKNSPRPKQCHVISRFSVESFSQCLDVHEIRYEMIGDEEIIVSGEKRSPNSTDIHCLEIFPNMNERDHTVDCFRTNNYTEWGIDFKNTVDQLKKVREKVPQTKVSHFNEDIDLLISIDQMNIEQQQQDHSVSSDFVRRVISS